MGFKHKIKKINPVTWVLLSFFTITGCSENSKTAENTFYIELINFNDSLRDYISANSTGK